MILQDFFMSNLPINNANSMNNQKSESSITTSTISSDSDIETRSRILIKNPEIILLEDQHNSNSNCLVLNVRVK
jgi:hypothetical protein